MAKRKKKDPKKAKGQTPEEREMAKYTAQYQEWSQVRFVLLDACDRIKDYAIKNRPDVFSSQPRRYDDLTHNLLISAYEMHGLVKPVDPTKASIVVDIKELERLRRPDGTALVAKKVAKPEGKS